MKIGEQVRELTVVGNAGDTKKATISGDKMAKLQYLLTKGLYRDPITAVIAEWTNNGIDSVVQSGKDPLENPVIVTIGTNQRGQYTFSVEDKGTGLDDQEFENICMNYLESTKENDDNSIGHFGIGMKSFLSLERSATFRCRKNGMERMYLVYEGEEFVNYDLIIEKKTDEEDGVLAELVINSGYEKAQFIDKAKQKLAYYDTAALIVDGKPEIWGISRNDLFQRSSANRQSYMHLCLKDVYYAIDYEALGIRPLPYPIALRFGLTDGIVPTPSRESYITNEKTKKLIMNRIESVADWIIKKYNETVKEFDTFKDAYPYLSNPHAMLLLDSPSGGQDKYPLSPLSDYSTIPILKPMVKGIKLKDPSYYKDRRDDLFFEYLTVGYVNYSGIFRNKAGNGVSISHQVFTNKKNPIIVNDGLKGNVREYLKEKHGRETLFVRVNPEKRKLGGTGKVNNWTSYVHVLDLHTKSRKDWRGIINEWEFVRDQLFAEFVDERKVETTQEYLDWLDKKRLTMRSKRKAGVYKGLNKQVGDVTISHLHPHGKGKGVGWLKTARKIDSLTENQYLTVLIDNEDTANKDMAKVLYKMLGNNKIQFATVGKKEGKKIPEYFQFINFDKFMTRDCKPFMRLASAIAFEKALRDFKKITRSKNGIFQNCLAGLIKDSEELEKYVSENLKDTGDDEVMNYIIKVADEFNLYDMKLWDTYNRLKEGTKKYDFIVCLAEPRSWDESEVKRYNKTINQLLLFRKKYYNDLPENAKIVFEDELVTV